MNRPRIVPGPAQESVWDYPRPPRLERTSRHIRIVVGGRVLADTRAAWRVLETSHPPVYYLPPEDVARSMLRASSGTSFCEWKGVARYWDVVVGDGDIRRRAGWSYPDPTPAFAAIRDHIAFYAGLLDESTVDGEHVRAQPGGFYGGWITNDVVGPFKGDADTRGW